MGQPFPVRFKAVAAQPLRCSWSWQLQLLSSCIGGRAAKLLRVSLHTTAHAPRSAWARRVPAARVVHLAVLSQHQKALDYRNAAGKNAASKAATHLVAAISSALQQLALGVPQGGSGDSRDTVLSLSGQTNQTPKQTGPRAAHPLA